jgi:hypothetical protein
MADKGKTFDKVGAEEKRSFVDIKRAKAEGKAKLARRLTADQITVVGIQLDVPGQGIISLRPGGGAGNSWDDDLSDAKVDRDPTDQFFDMDNGKDGINDMDACDDLHTGGGDGPIA